MPQADQTDSLVGSKGSGRSIQCVFIVAPKQLAEAGLLNKDEKRFVKMFNESFTDLLNHYRVVIPLNEILYLYEYIFKDLGI